MAFLRVKRIRGREYAYLVESRWNAERASPRQAVVKYMGPLDGLRLQDVPPEHRNDRVKAFILRHSSTARERRRSTVVGFREKLLSVLTEGDRRAARAVVDEAHDLLGLDALYVDVLTPVMHEVGLRWKRRELTVSMEHLASNIVGDLVVNLNAGIRTPPRSRGLAIVCTPPGEMHGLVARVLEGLLLRRAYRVHNIGASAPTESVADFVRRKGPSLVLVSLTIPQYLPSLKRLVVAIRDRAPHVPLLVGGQGLRGIAGADFPPGVTLVAEGDTIAALDEACGIGH